eukprot:CAMPEP_0180794734 /NCGR_PEP_ID=MMETSP1038_2-20121128/55794_1 /TAXON_ID=632150 /ORGANISM="Azadinium spinosum, Strain 3D9" /LENGTH=345 /DNA_ID=CAMNT_0022833547 /DNA_START=302 /DNA_END=1337 /DNA_ORIENTATION=-
MISEELENTFSCGGPVVLRAAPMPQASASTPAKARAWQTPPIVPSQAACMAAPLSEMSAPPPTPLSSQEVRIPPSELVEVDDSVGVAEEALNMEAPMPEIHAPPLMPPPPPHPPPPSQVPLHPPALAAAVVSVGLDQDNLHPLGSPIGEPELLAPPPPPRKRPPAAPQALPECRVRRDEDMDDNAEEADMEDIYIITFTRTPQEFQERVHNGSELEPLRFFAEQLGYSCRCKGASVFVHPNQFPSVRQQVLNMELKPHQLVVSETYLPLVKKAVGRFGARRDVRAFQVDEVTEGDVVRALIVVTKCFREFLPNASSAQKKAELPAITVSNLAGGFPPAAFAALGF